MPPVKVLAAAQELQQFLTEKGWSYALIGGLAVMCRAEPRATVDVDISLLCDLGAERDWIDPLLERFTSRIGNAAEFALQHAVLLLVASNGVPIDIGLALFPFEAEMIQRATLSQLPNGLQMPVITADDLVVMKAFAGRPRDWDDLENLIENSDSLDWSAIQERLAAISELLDFEAVTEQLAVLRQRAKDSHP